MSEKLNIVLVLGTTRQQRRSVHVANLIKEITQKRLDLEVEFVDVQDFFPLPGEGNDEGSKEPRWAKINETSDAYILVVPEYNHGYPGSLKMLLDNDMGNYTHKPVLVVGVSSGSIGGARMVENLLGVLRELGMVTTFSNLYFPKVKDLFDEQGKLTDSNYRDYVNKALDELVWMATSLKWGRDNL